MDEILELNRDASAALATIREWMNSFVPINRVPLDVLSLIPTHLTSQKDRFRVTFVCRHWRRTFLQTATLWSHLSLSKGGVYVKTLLERAKGSPLSILASGSGPVDTLMLLAPHAKQIAELEFTNNRWVDVQRFSEINSGPLPLLRALTINFVEGNNWNSSDVLTSSSRPLFNEAVGLKELRLHSKEPLSLSHFIFPNLTSFELSVTSEEQFRGSQLLDFLEASPTLQAVRVKIVMILSLEGIPWERVVVLQHVESLCLTASESGPCYELANHISCPSVKNTSFTYLGEGGPYEDPPLETFPASDSLGATIRQYTRSPIEEVRLDMTGQGYFIACSLTFRSVDTTSITFCFRVDDETPESFSCDVFSKACIAIRDLSLLANVKYFHIYGLDLDEEPVMQTSHDLGGVLKSLGPLEELTIRHCDMRPFFSHYPAIVVYPPIKVLTLTDSRDTLEGDTARGLVKLAKAQHELGVSFERVTVRSYGFLAGVEEMLGPWVGAVDFVLYGRF